ncbi:Putative cytosolic protein [Flavobacterium psychrophilum]|nr:Putative cytosolic protein [Flavobacterium psychrophilum]
MLLFCIRTVNNFIMLLHPKKLFPEVENMELLNHQNVTKRDLLNFGNLLLAEFKSISNEEEKTAQWLKSSEVRKLLKISPGTLQNLRINGTLHYTRVGGIIYYKYDDIKKLLEM